MWNSSHKPGCILDFPASQSCHVRSAECTKLAAVFCVRPAALRAAQTSLFDGINPGCMVRVSAQPDSRAQVPRASGRWMIPQTATYHAPPAFRIGRHGGRGAGRACARPTTRIRPDRLSAGVGCQPYASGLRNCSCLVESNGLTSIVPVDVVKHVCRESAKMNVEAIQDTDQRRANSQVRRVTLIGEHFGFHTGQVAGKTSGGHCGHFQLLTRLPAGVGGKRCASHELNYTRISRKRKNIFELFFGWRGVA